MMCDGYQHVSSDIEYDGNLSMNLEIFLALLEPYGAPSTLKYSHLFQLKINP